MKKESVFCEDGKIYVLENNNRWARKEKFVGTVATYEKLPSKIVLNLMPSAVYEYVYKGKDISEIMQIKLIALTS